MSEKYTPELIKDFLKSGSFKAKGFEEYSDIIPEEYIANELNDVDMSGTGFETVRDFIFYLAFLRNHFNIIYAIHDYKIDEIEIVWKDKNLTVFRGTIFDLKYFANSAKYFRENFMCK